MATIRKRKSGAIEVIFRCKRLFPGQITRTFDDEEEARIFVQRVENKFKKGILPSQFAQEAIERKRGGFADRTLKTLIKEYQKSTSLSQEDQDKMRIHIERLGDESFLKIDYYWVERWILSMKREHNLAPGSIRKHVGSLSRLFTWAANKGMMNENPILRLPRGYAGYTEEDEMFAEKKVDKSRDVRIPPEDIAKIMDVIDGKRKRPDARRHLEIPDPDETRLIFTLAVESAMRLREMYTLSEAQVSLDKCTIFLDKTKNGDKRQVPLSSVANSALKDYLDMHPKGECKTDNLFPGLWNGELSVTELRKTTAKLSKRFGRILEHAGLPDASFHDLRHEATCQFFLRTTLTDTEIMRITGHKSHAMLKRYASLRGSELSNKLW
jgi:integrase